MTNNTIPQVLHFICDALAEENIESTYQLEMLDSGSLAEFAQMYHFSIDDFAAGVRLFQQAYLAEEAVMKHR